MKMNDPVFGEIEYEYGWTRDIVITFGSKETEITLMIDAEEDGNFDCHQYEAYKEFMQNWNGIASLLMEEILGYYKQKRYKLGYDIEVNENYPLVETTDQILEMISLDGIVIPYGDIFDGRDIGVTFNSSWDSENGLGLRLLNEQVVEVSYQDIVI